MKIQIPDRKLKAALEDDALCQRRFGVMTKSIGIRMRALEAAVSLHDFWPPKSKPERVHELQGELAGTFSIDVKQPYRLLFRPIDEPVPDERDQEARWHAIDKIEVLRIEDTHG